MSTITMKRPQMLLRALTSYYGGDWVTWDSETLELTMARNFKYEPTELELDQLMMVQNLLRDPIQFMQSAVQADTFIRLACGTPSTGGFLEGATPSMLAHGTAVIRRIIGEELFDAAVKTNTARPLRAYGAAVLYEGGLHVAPPSLGIDVYASSLALLSGASNDLRSAVLMEWSRLIGKWKNSPGKNVRDAIGPSLGVVMEEKKLKGKVKSSELFFAERQLVHLLSVATYMNLYGSLSHLSPLGRSETRPRAAIAVS